MIIGAVRELSAGERRVALVPDSVERLKGNRIEVVIESGAGVHAGADDAAYARSGARIETAPARLLEQVDGLVKIHPPNALEAAALRPGSALFCLRYPRAHAEVTQLPGARRVTTLALENLPRTTIAQPMDVLTSQSTAAGYRALIVAAYHLGKFFPMLMTAAGTLAPARADSHHR